MTALVARGLTKRYGGTAVVDGLDLSVERGELYGFLGPNGAGKTTTIRMALGLVRPSGGEVRVLGEPVAPGAPLGVLERVGAMIEEPAFYRFLSGRRNLEVFARAGRDPRDVRRRLSRMDELLELVGLTGAASMRVKAYSQGMRQRLGIALALLGDPEVLILDEPTNGLDPAGMREVRRLLRRLADGGTSVFVSSHLLSEVEAMCDRVGVLTRGRLVAEGTPDRLRGGADRLRIDVDDTARALRALASIDGVEATVDGRVIRTTLHRGATPAAVNAALVSAGVAVSALVPERESLEEAFLSLVEDGRDPR
ncbi:MAG TPA: ABC transporter ATP-binding protein [Actinomycetota bacterium]|nr:ABC transporter ATP-binding protein [Actinomycetota bacterium]